MFVREEGIMQCTSAIPLRDRGKSTTDTSVRQSDSLWQGEGGHQQREGIYLVSTHVRGEDKGWRVGSQPSMPLQMCIHTTNKGGRELLVASDGANLFWGGPNADLHVV